MNDGKPSNSFPKSLPTMFRALQSRNYRLFCIGQGIGLAGHWMQRIAMSWLVYRLTGSAMLLGITGFASQIPMFLLSGFAGVFVDRHNRHKILIWTQTLSMLQAFSLAALVFTGTITVWWIIVLSVLLGFIHTLDIPARQAFVLEMVEKRENLGNAIALNSSISHMTQLVGPAIAGFLITELGEGPCFTLNGVSYLAVISCLLAMHLSPPKIEAKARQVFKQLKEGFSYAYSFVPMRYLILLLAVGSLLGHFQTVLLPVFAKDILQGEANILGFLMSAAGIGAVIGTLYLASRQTLRGLRTIVGISAGIYGVSLASFALSRNLPLSIFLSAAIGGSMIIELAGINTIMQSIVDDDKRGRVMSFYAMFHRGVLPFGALLAGALASSLGTPNTVLIGGICCIIASIFFSIKLRDQKDVLRAAYVEKELINKQES